MAHTRYESEGLVLEANVQGEANGYYTLLTKEFGLIRGSAQGVRLSHGKLRYALQAFSHIRVSLVRGKEFWRIVGAEHIEHFWGEYGLQKDRLMLLAKVFKLLKRLVVGEETHNELYDSVYALIAYLKQGEVDRETLLLLELLVVARILMHLGYFKVTDVYSELLVNNEFNEMVFGKVGILKKQLLFDVTKALQETQL